VKISARILFAMLALVIPAGAVHAYNLDGRTWGGAGTTITYSFMATGEAFDETFINPPPGGYGPGTVTALADFMPADWQSEIVAALQSWEAVCDITFLEVADSGGAFNAAGAVNGDIRFAGHAFDGAFNVLAHGYYPPPNGSTAAGDVHFDTGESWQTPLNPGGSINFQTVAAHEVGHSIGLLHTAVGNSLMNPIYNPAITAPQADDISGAQAMYGQAGAGSGVPEPGFLALLVAPALAVYVMKRD